MIRRLPRVVGRPIWGRLMRPDLQFGMGGDRGTRAAGIRWILAVVTAIVGAVALAPNAGAEDPIRTADLNPAVAPMERVAELPRLLSAADVIRYRQIFVLQEAGDWSAADRLIGNLDDRILLGHVRFQRYMHPTAYTSRYVELMAWMKAYADLPGANRIHRLALKRRPSDAPAPRPPVNGYLRGTGEDLAMHALRLPRRDLQAWQRELVNELIDEVRARIRKGWPTGAARTLTRPELTDWLTAAEHDALRAHIGRSYFIHGKDDKALAFAGPAAERSGEFVPSAHWTAGLAAWRMGDLSRARHHFRSLARSDIDDSLLLSGAAFWAARVAARLGDTGEERHMLINAAAHTRSIYGLLALYLLGDMPAFDWDQPRFTAGHAEMLLKSKPARRAMALAEIGMHDLADQEIRKLYPQAGPRMAQALMRLTETLDLPALQIRIGSMLSKVDGRRHDGALYPVPAWQPSSGFKLDRALLFALVRRESGFDPEARSHAGARGLMQLMPATATYVDGKRRYGPTTVDALYAPDLNLELGQRYVRYLLDNGVIDGNLLFMLAAYNSGPGNLKKWLDMVDHRDDPLMFIESVPSAETRRHLRRVMANLWVYRYRMGQQPLSLAAVAEGRWPTYVEQDRNKAIADNGGN